MLDRMAALAPDWTERNPADAPRRARRAARLRRRPPQLLPGRGRDRGYLGTARLRVSARRHARLLDYRVHDGCNARAWVVFDVDSGSGADGQALDAGTVLLSRGDTDQTTVAPADLPKLLVAERPTVFETMYAITLNAAHNAIGFYTWSDEQCCLPKGATHATLIDDPTLALAVGDVVLFEEIRSPTTGLAGRCRPRTPPRRPADGRRARRGRARRHAGARDRLGRRRRAPVPALHLGVSSARRTRCDRGRARECRARRPRPLDSVASRSCRPRFRQVGPTGRISAGGPLTFRADFARRRSDAASATPDRPPRRAARRRRHGRGHDLDPAVRPARQRPLRRRLRGRGRGRRCRPPPLRGRRARAAAGRGLRVQRRLSRRQRPDGQRRRRGDRPGGRAVPGCPPGPEPAGRRRGASTSRRWSASGWTRRRRSGSRSARSRKPTTRR